MRQSTGERANTLVSIRIGSDKIVRMKKTAPIAFAGCELAESRHVCAFFNSDEEAYQVLLPFIADGFRCNHKAVHIVNPGEGCAHRKRLAAAGIDLKEAELVGQFDLRINTEAYLQQGKFSGDTVIDIMRTHPMVIIGGMLQQNPFYIPPQQFLQELRERRPPPRA